MMFVPTTVLAADSLHCRRIPQQKKQQSYALHGQNVALRVEKISSVYQLLCLETWTICKDFYTLSQSNHFLDKQQTSNI